MKENAGYTIRRSILFDNACGVVLGENPHAPAPFVTWRFNEQDGHRDYFWGHYHTDLKQAEADLTARAGDYQRQYRVRLVEDTGLLPKQSTIAQQMKEAAKLAEADRGAHAPKKNSPNRGERQGGIAMLEKYNPLKSAELSGEQNYNMIDGILNNAVAPLPQLPEKSVDKVREMPPKRRSREREER